VDEQQRSYKHSLSKVQDTLKMLLAKKDVLKLYKWFYDETEKTPTKSQQNIIRKILFREHNQLLINAYTRYGKTFTVARASVMKLGLKKNHRTAFIAPKAKLFKEFKREVGDAITSSTYMKNNLEITGKQDSEKLKRESTATRQTYKNGSEHIFLSAYKKEDLMSFGANTVVAEEDTHISREAQMRIGRILGDNPEKYQWIKLFNPESRDTHSYDAYRSDDWHNIHIPYTVGIRENRTTKDFIEKQRRDLTDVEFTIQYESEFPDQTKKGLLSSTNIERQVTEKKAEAKGKVYVGVDVAEHGGDETVITQFRKNGEGFVPVELYSEEDTELEELRERIENICSYLNKRCREVHISVDKVGVGAGIYSSLKSSTENFENVFLHSVVASAKPIDEDRFKDVKAEGYFHLKKLVEDEKLFLFDHHKLLRDLRGLEFDVLQGKKLKIQDPSKSPDYSDSVMHSLLPARETIQRDPEPAVVTF